MRQHIVNIVIPFFLLPLLHLYLWYSQSQGDATQQEQVAVDPVHQFVNAAVWVDVLPRFRVL